MIIVSDQLNSPVIKELVGRPAALPSGERRQDHERYPACLSTAAPGTSFTSSHAVNNAAAATVFAHYYPRWTWAFILWAALVALSRVFVGVHYPSDIVAGARHRRLVHRRSHDPGGRACSRSRLPAPVGDRTAEIRHVSTRPLP